MKRGVFFFGVCVFVCAGILTSCAQSGKIETQPLQPETETSNAYAEPNTVAVTLLEEMMRKIDELEQKIAANEKAREDKAVANILQNGAAFSENGDSVTPSPSILPTASPYLASSTEEEKEDSSQKTSISPKGAYSYTVQNREVWITAYLGSETNVVIPAAIVDLPVTKIADDAFAHTEVQTVQVADGIKEIGWFAFTVVKIYDRFNCRARLNVSAMPHLRGAMQI